MPRKNNEAAQVATCHPDRKHLARGLCKKCYDREYGAKNRDKMNDKAREWAANNRDRRLVIRRRYLYGIEPDAVRARLRAHDGLCKICEAEPASHLDHDHKTGRARSLLCPNCNRALGLFKEDPVRLRNAVRYLELWDDRAVQVIPNTGRRADGLDEIAAGKE